MLTGNATLVVVGAGPAGVAAAVEAARLGASPVLLDESGRAGGTILAAMEVRNLPSDRLPLSGADVGSMLEALLREWGIHPEEGRVVRVSVRGDSVIVATGCGLECACDLAVIATGTRARMPSVQGMPEGVLRTSARDVLRDPGVAEAAVIGGGDTAFDQARLLLANGLRVSLLCRSQAPSAPGWLVRRALGEGLDLRLSTLVRSAEAASGGVRLVCRDGGGESGIMFDAVVAAVGRDPVLPDGAAALASDRPDLVSVAGDADGSAGRYVTRAMAAGMLAARTLLEGIWSRS